MRALGKRVRTPSVPHQHPTEVDTPDIEPALAVPAVPAEEAPKKPFLPKRPAFLQQRAGEEHLYRPLDWSGAKELAEAPMSAPKPKGRRKAQ